MNEQRLIKRILAGDAAAERALYDDHVDRIYRLTYRMTGDETLAEDFTQDTFIRAFDRLQWFEGRSALSTWLHSIAVSVVLNGLRKVKRFRQRETALDETTGGGVVGKSGDPELKRSLHRAIDELSDGLRLVFVMHDIEGYKHQEIAAILDVPEGTSKSRLATARGQLRDCLTQPDSRSIREERL
ncbi:MAG: RNA polymerase sigma factor [bacterium]